MSLARKWIHARSRIDLGSLDRDEVPDVLPFCQARMHVCQDGEFIGVNRSICRNAIITPVLLVETTSKQEAAQALNLLSDPETQYEQHRIELRLLGTLKTSH